MRGSVVGRLLARLGRFPCLNNPLTRGQSSEQDSVVMPRVFEDKLHVYLLLSDLRKVLSKAVCFLGAQNILMILVIFWIAIACMVMVEITTMHIENKLFSVPIPPG